MSIYALWYRRGAAKVKVRVDIGAAKGGRRMRKDR